MQISEPSQKHDTKSTKFLEKSDNCSTGITKDRITQLVKDL